MRRRTGKYLVKSLGSTEELLGILPVLSMVGAVGTVGGAVICVVIYRNAKGEDRPLGHC